MVLESTKIILRHILPTAVYGLVRHVYLLLSKRGRFILEHERLKSKYIKHAGSRVRKGPFAGMHYLDQAVGSAILPKLAGTYELELMPLVRQIIESGAYDRIIDIGAAEGYYAVGFARSMPVLTVVAFEADERGRQLLGELAERNAVKDRVRIEGFCTVPALSRVVRSGVLIFCDCEGGEYELLDPVQIPGLCEVDMVVELHDYQDPRITPAMRHRFESTHELFFIDATPRSPSLLDDFNFLSEREKCMLVEERVLVGQQWVFMRRRNHVASGT